MSTRSLALGTLVFLGSALLGCLPGVERERASALITHRTLGLAYLEEDLLAQAANEFRQIIQLAPNQALGYTNLGLAYLRQGRYSEAEQQMRHALEIQPTNPDVNLNLARLYELSGRVPQAITQLEETVEASPGHVRSLGALVGLYRLHGDSATQRNITSYAQRLVALTPGNLAARLQLIEALLAGGDAGAATQHVEEVGRQVPHLAEEARDRYREALQLTRNGNARDALPRMIAVHNVLKIIPLYQAGIFELQGRGEGVGFPIVEFTGEVAAQTSDSRAVLENLRFVDVTDRTAVDSAVRAPASLDVSESVDSRLAVIDYDGDGDQDFYFVRRSRSGSGSFLVENKNGRFENISLPPGVGPERSAVSVAFGDYDNDGNIDLYAINRGPNTLYRSLGNGTFEDITARAGLSDSAMSEHALFADLDHDGDLDIYVANRGPNHFFRNNFDGTFSELAESSGLAAGDAPSRNAVFGDFDNDGDLDLVVTNDRGVASLYTNLRQSRFEATNISERGASSSLSAGDYNNDGALDIVVTAGDGSGISLYSNRGDGTFERDRHVRLPAGLSVADAEFTDFDNDGHLDILAAGASTQAGARNAILLHNDGSGEFENVSYLLPDELPPAREVVTIDYDDDGDMDILLATNTGHLRLLRNDGGNANSYLKVQLLGLSGGSGKNNHYGIGARLEVRAGQLYQLQVVTGPITHFGLGGRAEADAVRVQWTNGVPQNLFKPRANQLIVEEQVLKGSCTFLYTWDGERYVFVTDMMWKSALGMPLGIMAGQTSYAPPDASREYLRIPGHLLTENDGVYSIQITEELWEVAYLDRLNLIVLDHPDTVEMFVNERFQPPYIDSLEVYEVVGRRSPVSATDDRGNDLLPAMRDKDYVYAAHLLPMRYQGIVEMHDLVLDLGEIQDADSIVLFLNGWLFPTDASINVAVSQSDSFEVIHPYLQVPDASGQWQTVIENLSFPTGKNKTVIADLSGKFLAPDYRVRIRTNMEIYWDHVFFSEARQLGPARWTWLSPISADLHYRGFSRMYRRGGRYGPHWFDYNDVSTESPWLLMEGSYTRYGDVSALLRDVDDKYVIIQSGDEMTVEFDATLAPAVPAGWTRDYLIYSDGFLKDADLNTALGATVAPLPFHGMSHYPYGSNESYPDDEEHRRFVDRYLSRQVEGRLRSY